MIWIVSLTVCLREPVEDVKVEELELEHEIQEQLEEQREEAEEEYQKAMDEYNKKLEAWKKQKIEKVKCLVSESDILYSLF